MWEYLKCFTCVMYLKERAEKRVEEKLLLLSLEVERMDKPQKYEKRLNQMKSDEKNLHARITRFERQMWKELEEIQHEYRSGKDGGWSFIQFIFKISFYSNLLLQKILFSKDRKTLRLLFLSPKPHLQSCMG